jgi:predicted nuclease with RNAse H fold
LGKDYFINSQCSAKQKAHQSLVATKQILMRLSKAIATGKTKLIIKEGQHVLKYGQRVLPLTEKQFKKLKGEKKYS